MKFFDPDRDPFYTMYSIAEHTFAPHKVVWMDVSESMKACVVSRPRASILPLPEHTLMFVATSSAEEAHYLAAVLNSKPAATAIAGYIVDNHLSTHPCENIILPRFDASKELHQHLAAASRQAHASTAAEDLEELAKAQAAIDRLVNDLW
jgi:hypothetical protein